MFEILNIFFWKYKSSWDLARTLQILTGPWGKAPDLPRASAFHFPILQPTFDNADTLHPPFPSPHIPRYPGYPPAYPRRTFYLRGEVAWAAPFHLRPRLHLLSTFYLSLYLPRGGLGPLVLRRCRGVSGRLAVSDAAVVVCLFLRSPCLFGVDGVIPGVACWWDFFSSICKVRVLVFLLLSRKLRCDVKWMKTSISRNQPKSTGQKTT